METNTLPVVTIDNYSKLAVRTEAPVTSAIMDRLSNPVVLDSFLRYVYKAIYYSRVLDKFKKHFFYGRAVSSRTGFAGAPQFDETELFGNETLELKNEEAFLEKLKDPKNVRLLHAILGIGTEAGELFEALWSLNDGKDIDTVNVNEERGDLAWYDGLLADITGESPMEVRTKNIHKLAKRYGDKFSDVMANNRNLTEERAILEGVGQKPQVTGHPVLNCDPVPAKKQIKPAAETKTLVAAGPVLVNNETTTGRFASTNSNTPKTTQN